MQPGALFTDVLSVKSGICESYEKLKDKYPHIELLSTHPMFAPAAGWVGMNCVMIQIRGGPMTERLSAMIESWGCKTVAMPSGKEHDRVTASVQNATHAALLSFGLCLSKLGYDAAAASRMSTPPHRNMVSCINRMATINEPDTYWDIQTDNPHADEVWEQLEQAVRELRAAVRDRDRERFAGIIAGFRELTTVTSPESDTRPAAY